MNKHYFITGAVVLIGLLLQQPLSAQEPSGDKL